MTPKIIVTLGPATSIEADIKKIKDKGVDFVRINMSHSSTEDLRHFIHLAKAANIPFIIDTEGSQIRTGSLEKNEIQFDEGNVVRVYNTPIIGNKEKICLTPPPILQQLKPGDLIFVDFDTLIFKVSDVSTIKEGYIQARIVSSGNLGNKKATVIVSAAKSNFQLPVLSEKDKESIRIGLSEGVGHIAVSFVRKGEDIDEVRRVTNNAMHIISKVEARDSLRDIDNIIKKSDSILLDRGDLSKEVPVEKVPLIQKIILKKAKESGTPVFVATNLLETMIKQKKPTRAEVNDVINTILDGADGLILSAETAIGKYPMRCINMMNKLIEHSKLLQGIDNMNYLSEDLESDSLIEPHGGKLIDRFIGSLPEGIGSFPKIQLTKEQLMDIEQIAIGTFSPLEGFMCRDDFQGVLDELRLSNGIVWPIPLVLDITEEMKVSVGDDVALTDENDKIMAIMHVEDRYHFDKTEMANKLYCTNDQNHPGVKMVTEMKPVLLGGKIDLLKRNDSSYKEYELAPKQVRRLFEDRGWVKVVGFHTRNVIHKGHEFIQLQAMEKENCDGLFVHPIIGKKKSGDFNSKYIIQSYEKMVKDIYPKNKVVFATFSTFSRYAGPREAIFTALCRKNFGCSHFIVGRDHTGVGNYYHPNASHQIFDKFPEIGIKPVRFGNVFYSNKKKEYIHGPETEEGEELEKMHISGTQARETLNKGEFLPEWFMHPEISKIIVEAIKKGEEVFVR